MHVARFARVPQHRAEAARIAEPQHEFVEDPVDVVVLRGDRHAGRGQHAQRARHAEVDDEPARVDLEQQVLAATLDGAHLARAQLLGGPAGTGQRSISVRTSTRSTRRPATKADAPARDFDFWQLWHVLRV